MIAIEWLWAITLTMLGVIGYVILLLIREYRLARREPPIRPRGMDAPGGRP